MPKKKIIHHDEPVSARPHRTMKAKVVFDPSDNHIPKKRAKKCIETTSVKKTTTDIRKKQDAKKSKSLPVTDLTELFGCSSTEINTISPMDSPTNSAEESFTPQVTQTTSKNCFICLKKSAVTELLIDCPICSIKVHVNCLMIDEPLWKFKLRLCPWLCKKCRIQNCCKCFKDGSQSEILRRCITCEVGLHAICYESYSIKPLHKIDTDLYVCIPCMTLATQLNPEEEEDQEEFGRQTRPRIIKDLEDDDESITSSFVSTSSDEDDTDSKSNGSDSLSDLEDFDRLENDYIPNTVKWSKDEVFDYFSKHLPAEIIDQIIKYDIDGRTLRTLERTKIISSMGLKLGPALRVYQQVRILQSRSKKSQLLWE